VQRLSGGVSVEERDHDQVRAELAQVRHWLAQGQTEEHAEQRKHRQQDQKVDGCRGHAAEKARCPVGCARGGFRLYGGWERRRGD
jgi:hypothetical protein